MTGDCVDCQEEDGTCQWAGCPNPADYVLRDVTVKRQGLTVNVGDIDLCGGHKTHAERLGRLELDWERVLRAVT